MILSSLLPARLLRLLPRRVSRSLLNKSATGPHALPQKSLPPERKAFLSLPAPKSVAGERVAGQHSESVILASFSFVPFVVVAHFNALEMTRVDKNTQGSGHKEFVPSRSDA